MTPALLVDLGSTYTKAVAVDLETACVLSAVRTPTTSTLDISIGLETALAKICLETGLHAEDFSLRRACSSAAGGLRMVAIGLVASLTTEAATRAALGAGARLVRAYSHRLTRSEMRDIEALGPDIVLLAGGTDGGDAGSITDNARVLATSPLACPIVVAGNRKAMDEVLAVLTNEGKPVVATENVMPELNTLNVEPARAVIRDVFASHIVRAKGIDRAQRFLDDVVMPTPMAVLEAAKLLAGGGEVDPGVGELVIVDVGGATTDVHSVAKNEPSDPNVILKGLPQPEAMRTVEGDLGLRVNAESILGRAATTGSLSADLRHALGTEGVTTWAERVQTTVSAIPTRPAEVSYDVALARAAVHFAVERHAGTVTPVYTPRGLRNVQEGKDLGSVSTVVGTGGIFGISAAASASILAEASASERDPLSLRPQRPAWYADSGYTLFVGGLLASEAPDVALAVLRGSLQAVEL